MIYCTSYMVHNILSWDSNSSCIQCILLDICGHVICNFSFILPRKQSMLLRIVKHLTGIKLTVCQKSFNADRKWNLKTCFIGKMFTKLKISESTR